MYNTNSLECLACSSVLRTKNRDERVGVGWTACTSTVYSFIPHLSFICCFYPEHLWVHPFSVGTPGGRWSSYQHHTLTHYTCAENRRLYSFEQNKFGVNHLWVGNRWTKTFIDRGNRTDPSTSSFSGVKWNLKGQIDVVGELRVTSLRVLWKAMPVVTSRQKVNVQPLQGFRFAPTAPIRIVQLKLIFWDKTLRCNHHLQPPQHQMAERLIKEGDYKR